MSYIHEALKKAQKERDGRYQNYSRALLARRPDPSPSSRRLALWGSLAIAAGIVGLGVYFWQPPVDPTVVAVGPQQAPVPKPVKKTEQDVPPGNRLPDIQQLHEKAVALQRNGRLVEARKAYETVLTRDPGYVDALNNLGVLHIRSKNYGAARKSFEKAIVLDPRYVDPRYNLACVYAFEGKVDESLAHLRKAVSMDGSVREWAKRDPDLKGLRGNPEFEMILKSSNPTGDRTGSLDSGEPNLT